MAMINNPAHYDDASRECDRLDLGPAAADVLAAIADLRAEVAALRAEIGNLRVSRRVASTAKSGSVGDALVEAIAMAAHSRYSDREFTASELIGDAGADIRAALSAAGITSARSLGRTLSRSEGVDLGGLTLERIGAERCGLLWRVFASLETRRNSQTRQGPSTRVSRRGKSKSSTGET